MQGHFRPCAIIAIALQAQRLGWTHEWAAVITQLLQGLAPIISMQPSSPRQACKPQTVSGAPQACHIGACVVGNIVAVCCTCCACRAFLDPYAQFTRFSNDSGQLSVDEFMDAKDVVMSLSKEYEACERSDYVSICTDWCLLTHNIQLPVV